MKLFQKKNTCDYRSPEKRNYQIVSILFLSVAIVTAIFDFRSEYNFILYSAFVGFSIFWLLSSRIR